MFVLDNRVSFLEPPIIPGEVEIIYSRMNRNREIRFVEHQLPHQFRKAAVNKEWSTVSKDDLPKNI